MFKINIVNLSLYCPWSSWRDNHTSA